MCPLPLPAAAAFPVCAVGSPQTSFFFGYNAVVCYAFFLMLGSVGFRASLLFVRRIYRWEGREGACLGCDVPGR